MEIREPALEEKIIIESINIQLQLADMYEGTKLVNS